MSGEVIGKVLDHSKATGTDLLVLLAIADRSKGNGVGARPPVAEIMRRTKVSKSTVLRALGRLEAAGELMVVRSHRRPNEYVVTLADCAPRRFVVTPKGVSPRRHPRGVTAMTPPTSGTSSTSGLRLVEESW